MWANNRIIVPINHLNINQINKSVWNELTKLYYYSGIYFNRDINKEDWSVEQSKFLWRFERYWNKISIVRIEFNTV